LATVTAIAAVAAGSTLATRTAVAAAATGATLAAGAAATAGGIEVGRAADRVDVIDHVATGHGCGRQRNHRRGQKHTRDRAESSHMTKLSQPVARLAISLRAKAISHLLASCEQAITPDGYGLCAHLVELRELVVEGVPDGILNSGGRLDQVVDAQLFDRIGHGIGGVDEITRCSGICFEPVP
jgi:hypothetical protein